MHVNVEGGTGAGRKKPLHPARREPWTCSGCGRVNQGFIVRCIGAGCNEDRPK